MAISLSTKVASLCVGCVVAGAIWVHGERRVDGLITRSLGERGITIVSLDGADLSCMLSTHTYGRDFKGIDASGAPVSGTVCARPSFLLPEAVMIMVPSSKG